MLSGEQKLTARECRQAGEATYGRPREVQGSNDERTQVHNVTEYPWRALGLLRIRSKLGRHYIGTGWFIGPRLVVTAGHCVFLHEDGLSAWAEHVEVIPGGAAAPFGSYSHKTLFADPLWQQAADPTLDYGAIILHEDVGSKVGTFGFRDYPTNEILQRTYTLAGYPSLKPPVKLGGPYEEANGTLWLAQGGITGIDSAYLYYQIDTGEGQSGSPLFFIQDGLGWVAALHRWGDFGANQALRLTQRMSSNLERWLAEA